jgi:hypothetical protein
MSNNKQFTEYLEKENLYCSIEGLNSQATKEQITEYFINVLENTTIEKETAKTIITDGIMNCTGFTKTPFKTIIEIVEKL